MRMTGPDPLFKSAKPLIFAHRGGKGEAPESTEKAILHTAQHGDVLELDLRLTKDCEIVLWHGPGMTRTYDRNGRRLDHRDIRDWDWAVLEGNVFVMDPLKPGEKDDRQQIDHPDLGNERRLLRLAELPAILTRADQQRVGKGIQEPLGLNLELKSSKRTDPRFNRDRAYWGRKKIWESFFAFLNAEHSYRPIVLASGKHSLIKRFRNENSKRGGPQYPTGLSMGEQLAYKSEMKGSKFFSTGNRNLARCFIKIVGPILRKKKKKDLSKHPFQTSWALASQTLAKTVHDHGGSLQVFLTKYPFIASAVDSLPDAELKSELSKLLDMGVDGFMTDYPARVRDILDNM